MEDQIIVCGFCHSFLILENNECECHTCGAEYGEKTNWKWIVPWDNIRPKGKPISKTKNKYSKDQITNFIKGI